MDLFKFEFSLFVNDDCPIIISNSSSCVEIAFCSFLKCASQLNPGSFLINNVQSSIIILNVYISESTSQSSDHVFQLNPTSTHVCAVIDRLSYTNSGILNKGHIVKLNSKLVITNSNSSSNVAYNECGFYVANADVTFRLAFVNVADSIASNVVVASINSKESYTDFLSISNCTSSSPIEYAVFATRGEALVENSNFINNNGPYLAWSMTGTVAFTNCFAVGLRTIRGSDDQVGNLSAMIPIMQINLIRPYKSKKSIIRNPMVCALFLSTIGYF